MAYRLSVDLGTTFTAAAVERDGRAEVVQLGDHAPQVPSVVFVREDGALLVGEGAVRRGTAQPDRVAREFKRRLGDAVPYVLGGQPFRPEQLTAKLLSSVVATVQERQGTAPDRIALTHPANWGRHRTNTLLDAVRLAEIGPVTTITEPAAAAVHFASTERAADGDIIAVYDLGGGTFDAAVLRRTAKEFQLMGTPEGVEQLGGIDFDDAVFRHVLRTLGPAMSELDVDTAPVLAGLARLRRDCTDAKEALSTDSEATVPVALPGVTTTVRITRGEFEDMVRPSIEQTLECLRRAMASAKVEAADLRSVVLVGGSARIPLVAEMVGHNLMRPVAVSPQPKHAVALGAALLAGGALPKSPRKAPASTAAPGGRANKTRANKTRANKTRANKTTAPRPATAPAPRPVPSSRQTRPVQTANHDRLWWLLGGLVSLVLVLAFLVPLIGAPARSSGGQVGAGAGTVEVDLGSTKVALTSVDQEAAARASLFGVELGNAGVDTNRLDLTRFDGWLAGPVLISLESQRAKTDVAVRSANPVRAATFWLPVGIGLFVLAYVESLLRPIRRQRPVRALDLVAMAALGALLGLAVALSSWAIAGNVVSAWVVVATVLATAAAGVVTTRLVAARASRRRGGSSRDRAPAR